MVSNGNLLDETLEFIKEACLENDDEEQYIALLYSINTIMKTHLENFDNKKEDKTNLVVALSDDGTSYSLKYERMIPILVKALQEADAKIEALTTRITTLEG